MFTQPISHSQKKGKQKGKLGFGMRPAAAVDLALVAEERVRTSERRRRRRGAAISRSPWPDSHTVAKNIAPHASATGPTDCGIRDRHGLRSSMTHQRILGNVAFLPSHPVVETPCTHVYSSDCPRGHSRSPCMHPPRRRPPPANPPCKAAQSRRADATQWASLWGDGLMGQRQTLGGGAVEVTK